MRKLIALVLLMSLTAAPTQATEEMECPEFLSGADVDGRLVGRIFEPSVEVRTQLDAELGEVTWIELTLTEIGYYLRFDGGMVEVRCNGLPD